MNYCSILAIKILQYVFKNIWKQEIVKDFNRSLAKNTSECVTD